LVVALVVLAGGCREKAAPPPPELFAPAPSAATARPSAEVPRAAAPAEAAADAVASPPTAAGPEAATATEATTDATVPPTPPPADRVQVAAILIAWKGSIPDPRVERDADAAEAESARLLAAAAAEGADFFALMWAHSDDPGDGVYRLDAHSAGRFAAPLVERALRLAIGQVDRVRTRFGWHVLLRLPDDAATPPRPAQDRCGRCPLPGEDPATCVQRPAVTPDATEVESILVAWRGTPGGAGPARTREEARALALELCHAVRTVPGQFDALRTRHSDDPGTGRYRVRPDSALAEGFRRMALGLTPGNVAVVETAFGWHVLRRIR
jgi:hypothetical protein